MIMRKRLKASHDFMKLSESLADGQTVVTFLLGDARSGRTSWKVLGRVQPTWQVYEGNRVLGKYVMGERHILEK